MTGASPISVTSWRISRAPFVIYLGGLLFCGVAFSATKEPMFFFLTGLGLLFAPLPLSMRLRDAGRTPIWVLPLFVGLAFLAYRFLGAIASVSGAPNGGPPSASDRIENYVFYAVIGMLALLVTYGAIAKSSVKLVSNEVPS